MRVSRITSVLVPGLVLACAAATSVKADVLEDLVFTGTATCLSGICQGFGTGPLTGAYTLDVTTQTIVGPWSFSAPFGVLSSTDTGAGASINPIFGASGVNNADFAELTFSPPFFELVNLAFPINDPQEVGAVLAGAPFSLGCQNVPAPQGVAACNVDYDVTGETVLESVTPEPSLTLLVGAGMLGLVVLTVARRRSGPPSR